MTLIPISACADAPLYLYALLLERPAEACISHKRMPTVAEHLSFVRSDPYEAWYLVVDDAVVLGSVYLTRQREIGVSIFRDYQGQRHGDRAVTMLRELHPGPVLANVAPGNVASQRFFEGLGFKQIQVTYHAST